MKQVLIVILTLFSLLATAQRRSPALNGQHAYYYRVAKAQVVLADTSFKPTYINLTTNGDTGPTPWNNWVESGSNLGATSGEFVDENGNPSGIHGEITTAGSGSWYGVPRTTDNDGVFLEYANNQVQGQGWPEVGITLKGFSPNAEYIVGLHIATSYQSWGDTTNLLINGQQFIFPGNLNNKFIARNYLVSSDANGWIQIDAQSRDGVRAVLTSLRILNSSANVITENPVSWNNVEAFVDNTLPSKYPSDTLGEFSKMSYMSTYRLPTIEDAVPIGLKREQLTNMFGRFFEGNESVYGTHQSIKWNTGQSFRRGAEYENKGLPHTLKIWFNKNAPVGLKGIHLKNNNGNDSNEVTVFTGEPRANGTIKWKQVATGKINGGETQLFEFPEDTTFIIKLEYTNAEGFIGLVPYGKIYPSESNYWDFSYIPSSAYSFEDLDVGKNISTNTFYSIPMWFYQAFVPGAIHRGYNNMDWAYSLYDQKLQHDPMRKNGSIHDAATDLLNEHGQYFYHSTKSAPLWLPYAYVKWNPEATAPNGDEFKIEYLGDTIVVEGTDVFKGQKYYNRDTGDTIPEGLYPIIPPMEFVIRNWNSDTAFLYEEVSQLEIIGGDTAKYPLFERNRENKLIDPFADASDPNSYKKYYGKHLAVLAAMYGDSIAVANNYVDTFLDVGQPKYYSKGLITSYQSGNEPNAYWETRRRYSTSEEEYAKNKGIGDLLDSVTGGTATFVTAGYVGDYSNRDYYKEMFLMSAMAGLDNNFEALGSHIYWSTAGSTSDHNNTTPEDYGLTPEQYGAWKELDSMQALFEKYARGVVVYVDEYGYDRSPQSVQSLRLPDYMAHNPERLQAEGFLRAYNIFAQYPHITNKPDFMSRSDRDSLSDWKYGTSGAIASGTNQNKPYQRWYALSDYTHEFDGFRFDGILNYRNRDKTVWTTIFEDISDTSNLKYFTNVWKSDTITKRVKLFANGKQYGYYSISASDFLEGINQEIEVVNDSVEIKAEFWSKIVGVMDTLDPPVGPVEIQMVDYTSTSAHLDWKPTPGDIVKNYVAQLYQGVNLLQTDTLTASETKIQYSGLSSGLYEFRLYSYNSTGSSPTAITNFRTKPSSEIIDSARVNFGPQDLEIAGWEYVAPNQSSEGAFGSIIQDTISLGRFQFKRQNIRLTNGKFTSYNPYKGSIPDAIGNSMFDFGGSDSIEFFADPNALYSIEIHGAEQWADEGEAACLITVVTGDDIPQTSFILDKLWTVGHIYNFSVATDETGLIKLKSSPVGSLAGFAINFMKIYKY